MNIYQLPIKGPQGLQTPCSPITHLPTADPDVFQDVFGNTYMII